MYLVLCRPAGLPCLPCGCPIMVSHGPLRELVGSCVCFCLSGKYKIKILWVVGQHDVPPSEKCGTLMPAPSRGFCKNKIKNHTEKKTMLMPAPRRVFLVRLESCGFLPF